MVIELPYISSIEVRAVKTLDCDGIDGTTSQKMTSFVESINEPHTYLMSPHLENVIGDKEYLVQTPEENLQLEMECAPVDEKLEEQRQQIAGKS